MRTNLQRAISRGVVLLMLMIGNAMTFGQTHPLQQGKIVVVPYGNTGTRIEHFVTTRNIPARQPISATIAWDRHGLRVQFDCVDDEIVAQDRFRNDREMWQDDCVEVFLDIGHTHDETSRWVHVLVSANGDIYDEVGPMIGVSIGNPSVNLPGLQTSVERTPTGWRTRIMAPWSDLGAMPKSGDIWGFNLTRTDHPAGEYTSYSPTWGPFHNMSQWGHLVFARDRVPDEAAIARAIQARHTAWHDEMNAHNIKKFVMKHCLVAMPPIEQTWVEIDGVSYGARPDERGPLGGGEGYAAIITTGDYQVSTLDSLLNALRQAQAGDVIFIDGNAEIDCTVRTYIEGLVLEIPGGVTLASDRGHNGSLGAMIFSDTFKTAPLIRCLGNDVRISGLRLRGPDPEQRLDLHRTSTERGARSERGFDHDYYYQFPTSQGILTEFSGLEVDNCELAGWSHAAIFLSKGDRHHIHHNYIHHNQRQGLGYGVSHGYNPVASLIERNVFDANRHSIAATGAPGNAYEACHNVELGQSLSHCFDMHGGSDRRDGTDVAGAWMKVHHNTFRSQARPIVIRGLPEEEVVIHHN